jgi:hypothetical protein
LCSYHRSRLHRDEIFNHVQTWVWDSRDSPLHGTGTVDGRIGRYIRNDTSPAARSSIRCVCVGRHILAGGSKSMVNARPYVHVIYCSQLFSGKVPFHEKSDFAARSLLCKGDRPLIPEGRELVGLTSPVWELIEQCWAQGAKDRPHPRVFLDDGVLTPIAEFIPEVRVLSRVPSRATTADSETTNGTSSKMPRSPVKTRSRAKAPITANPIAGPSSKPLSPKSSAFRKRPRSGSDHPQPGHMNKRKAQATRIHHQ